MGPLDDTEVDLKEIALSALHPNGGVSTHTLERSGLHLDVFDNFMQVFTPQISQLVGWKPLDSFGYAENFRQRATDMYREYHRLDMTWEGQLSEHHVKATLAIRLFDGEHEDRRRSAPPYRLYLLKSGSMLYYAGGEHAQKVPCPFQVIQLEPRLMVEMLATVKDSGDPFLSFGAEYDHSFLFVMRLLTNALQRSVQQRKRVVENQQALHDRLSTFIQRVSSP